MKNFIKDVRQCVYSNIGAYCQSKYNFETFVDWSYIDYCFFYGWMSKNNYNHLVNKNFDAFYKFYLECVACAK